VVEPSASSVGSRRINQFTTTFKATYEKYKVFKEKIYSGIPNVAVWCYENIYT
jgi:hypothetical protein